MPTFSHTTTSVGRPVASSQAFAACVSNHAGEFVSVDLEELGAR